eukprot:4311951-Pyramimonas_sp.AAC.1
MGLPVGGLGWRRDCSAWSCAARGKRVTCAGARVSITVAVALPAAWIVLPTPGDAAKNDDRLATWIS